MVEDYHTIIFKHYQTDISTPSNKIMFSIPELCSIMEHKTILPRIPAQYKIYLEIEKKEQNFSFFYDPSQIRGYGKLHISFVTSANIK